MPGRRVLGAAALPGVPPGGDSGARCGRPLPHGHGGGGARPHVPHGGRGRGPQPRVPVPCPRGGPRHLVPGLPPPQLQPPPRAGGGRAGPAAAAAGRPAQPRLPAPRPPRQRPLLLPRGGRPRRRAVLRHLPARARARGHALPQHQGVHQEPHHHGRGRPAAALRRGARPAAALQEALGQRAAAADQEEHLRGGEPLRGAEPGRVLHVRGHLAGAAAHLPGRGQPARRRRAAGEALRGRGGSRRTLAPPPRAPLEASLREHEARPAPPPRPNKAAEPPAGSVCCWGGSGHRDPRPAERR